MTRADFVEARYQQDGAPAHTSRIAQQTLRRLFGDRVIGRGGIIDWPLRSPDLNPLDFFVWGHSKSILYRQPIENRMDLELRFDAAIRTVTPQMLRKSHENLLIRARCCIEIGGGHFEHLL